MIIEQLDHVPPRLDQILGNDLIGVAGSLRLGFGQTHKRSRGVRVDRTGNQRQAQGRRVSQDILNSNPSLGVSGAVKKQEPVRVPDYVDIRELRTPYPQLRSVWIKCPPGTPICDRLRSLVLPSRPVATKTISQSAGSISASKACPVLIVTPASVRLSETFRQTNGSQFHRIVGFSSTKVTREPNVRKSRLAHIRYALPL